jgi:hypothetical protein
VNFIVFEGEVFLATINGSATIESDLGTIYSQLEDCLDTFDEWINRISLEPFFDESFGETETEAAQLEDPTWDKWLQERFPLPSDRNLTMGRISHELFGCGDCNRVQAHSPDFWQCLRHNSDEYLWSESGPHPDEITVLDFVELCTIEWYDPFVR